MTDTELRIPNPTTEDQFETALGRLLRRAHDNAIDVTTGWMYPHDERYPDWNVEPSDTRRPRTEARLSRYRGT